MQQNDWNWAAAETEFKRAIELDPADAYAHQRYAFLLARWEDLETPKLK